MPPLRHYAVRRDRSRCVAARTERTQKRERHPVKKDVLAAIAWLDEETAASPRFTRGFALVVVALGFLYILFVLAAIIAVGWAIASWLLRQQEPQFLILLVPSVLYLFISVLTACFARRQPVRGIELTREDAPGLFAILDELAPRFDVQVHKVVLNSKPTAAATSERRWLFSRRRNVLVVGYPILCSGDAIDWRGTLAHELAHIKKADTQNLTIPWRALSMWRDLDERLRQGKHWASILFTWFFQRFGRVVEVLIMALRRQQEREADAAAAEVVGARAYSEAALREIVRQQLATTNFWKPINERAKSEPDPPAGIYSKEMPSFFERVHELNARATLRVALRYRTEWHHTHPSTYDRYVKALGITEAEVDTFVDAWVLPPIGQPALSEFLSDSARTRVAAELDAEWQQVRAKTWAEKYARSVDRREELETLEAEMQSRELSIDERIDRARLIWQLRDDQSAEAVARETLRDSPNDATLLLILGAISLERDDPAGVELLERAIAAAPAIAKNAYQMLGAHARRRGDIRGAMSYDEQYHHAEQRDRERETDQALSGASQFAGAGLSPVLIDAITQPLPNEPRIRRAWLAEIVVRHATGRRTFVLLLDTGWWLPGIRRRDLLLTQRIAPECQFPGKGWVATIHTRPRLRRRIRRAAGPPAYVRRLPSTDLMSHTEMTRMT